MKRQLIVMGAMVALTLPTCASYRIFSFSDVHGLFLTGTNYNFDQTDGQKSFAGHAIVSGGAEVATADDAIRFGAIGSAATSSGYYTAGRAYGGTDDVLHFTNPSGLPMQVRFDLNVRGSIVAPPPAYLAQVSAFISLGDPSNPFATTEFKRKYSNGNLVQSSDPTALIINVNSGASFNLHHALDIQQSALTPDVQIVCNYMRGSTVKVTVLTPGATFTSDSGSKYAGLKAETPVPSP